MEAEFHDRSSFEGSVFKTSLAWGRYYVSIFHPNCGTLSSPLSQGETLSAPLISKQYFVSAFDIVVEFKHVHFFAVFSHYILSRGVTSSPFV